MSRVLRTQIIAAFSKHKSPVLALKIICHTTYANRNHVVAELRRMEADGLVEWPSNSRAKGHRLLNFAPAEGNLPVTKMHQPRMIGYEAKMRAFVANCEGISR
jgi:hypothetical protein